MRRGILISLLCAIVVATMGASLVTVAFLRPAIFNRWIGARGASLIGDGRPGPGFSNAEIVSAAGNSVVTVIASRSLPLPQGHPPLGQDGTNAPDGGIQRGTGTGFIIDESGLIVTNEHVIKDSERIRVKLADGRERRAAVQGVDPSTDIALLKIEADGLTPLQLGDSAAVRVGDHVIAIGNPLEYEHSVTAGIVSAKGRKVFNDKPYEEFIQTDAAINRGNSGGPLLNGLGEVIGVNTVIRVDGRGISFAVPSNVVRRVVTQLRSYGFVVRGFLGLTPVNLTPEFRDGLGLGNIEGILVSDVSPELPAARAGIQPYDVITHFDNRPVTRIDDFFSLVAGTLPRQQVELRAIRSGRELKFVATLDSRPDEKPVESRPVLQKAGLTLGFSVRENTPEVLRELRLTGLDPTITGGVLISEVDPLSPAADSRLVVGQIILEANREPIRSLGDFTRVTSGLKQGSALVLRVTPPTQRVPRLVALRIGEL